VKYASSKTAELARPHYELLPVYRHDQRTAQNDETLIADRMFVGRFACFTDLNI
jgi:hypothetical protein